MTVEPSELLDRISATLRHEVGPEVPDEYTRTQTFMASVVLAKLAKQLSLAEEHSAAERSDVQELHRQLDDVLADAPDRVKHAAAGAKAEGTIAGLSPLITVIHEVGADAEHLDRALSLIRRALRRDIDRRMEIAR